ncbi:MAG: hypothetical protein V1725_04215 [archaeon]
MKKEHLHVIEENTAQVKIVQQSIPTKNISFYNPVMKKNRDLSVVLLNSLGKKNMSMMDLMAASGVRTVRFLKELSPSIIRRIVANDLSPGFAERMRETLRQNGFENDDRIVVQERDANLALLESNGFDYIDIDPYGSPNPFLDNAIVRLARKGILAVTATDTAALCGARLNTGRRKYWAEPLNNELRHELGLRMLIRKIQLLGAHHEKALTPVFSYFSDHYFRVFLQCEKGNTKVDTVLKQHQHFLYCSSCLSMKTSKSNNETCRCGKAYIIAGPLWTGFLSNENLVKNMLANTEYAALKKFLASMEGDCTDIVGFYETHVLAEKKLIPKLPRMDVLFNSDILRTHFSNSAVKTKKSPAEFVRHIHDTHTL